MKFLKTILIILCVLIVIGALLCVLISIEILRLEHQSYENIDTPRIFDAFVSAGITFFVIIALAYLIYVFVLSVNFRSVKRGRGRFFNVISILQLFPVCIFFLPFSVATLLHYQWNIDYMLNLFIALMLVTCFGAAFHMIYSIAALVCSNKNEKDLDKEKEDRLVRRIAELEYNNPYKPQNNAQTNYYDLLRKK